jgi:hypothetical protein
MDLKQLLSHTNISLTDGTNDGTTNDGTTNDGTTNDGTTKAGTTKAGTTKEDVIDDFNSDVEEEEVEEEDVVTIDPRFTLPWNKLDKGVKMNRLLIFVQAQLEELKLTEQQAKELKNLLFKACETGLFNKITDVEYDESTAVIESIKNLEFNESTKKYKIKTGGTKNRSVSKSRSNIDRLTKKK